MSYIFQPNGTATIITSNSKTFSATGAVVTPIFRITGSIRILKLYGVVTTVLNAAWTAAYWRLNDQTAQVDITLNTGTTLSSASVGARLEKTGLAAAALTLVNSNAGRVTEAGAVNQVPTTMFEMTQKTGAINTDIEFLFTKDAGASSGVIQFFVEWQAMSADGAVVAL